MVSSERIDLIFVNIRRFLARVFDIVCYTFLCDFMMYSVMNLMLPENWWEEAMIRFFPFVVMIFVEPLLLHLFGTTLGKAIFGLYIHTSNGNKLTYKEGLERTWKVFVYGQGLQIPIISLVCYIRSYIVAKRDEYLPWESGSVLTVVERKMWIQIIGFICIVFISFVSTCVQKSTILPTNRATYTRNIKKEELIENYERYLHYYKIEEAPILEVTEKEGRVTQVKLELTQDDKEMRRDDREIVISAFMAYVAAQNEISVFDVYGKNMLSLCDHHLYEHEDFSFSMAGVDIYCDFEKVEDNQEGSQDLESEEPQYNITFTMELIVI